MSVRTFSTEMITASHRASMGCLDVHDALLLARRGQPEMREFHYQDALREFDILAGHMAIIRTELAAPFKAGAA